jgi:hypothetical protein
VGERSRKLIPTAKIAAVTGRIDSSGTVERAFFNFRAAHRKNEGRKSTSRAADMI